MKRGAYRIIGMHIEKRGSRQPVPFFSTEQLDLAVRWRSLLAARISFSGSLNDPHVGVFQTMVSVVRNASVGAFSRSRENSISLHDVQKNLKEVGGDDPKPPPDRKQSSSQSRSAD